MITTVNTTFESMEGENAKLTKKLKHHINIVHGSPEEKKLQCTHPGKLKRHYDSLQVNIKLTVSTRVKNQSRQISFSNRFLVGAWFSDTYKKKSMQNLYFPLSYANF